MRLYWGQFDAENDCLVLDNVAARGYVQYHPEYRPEYHPEYHPEYQPEYQPEYHQTAAVSPRLLQHCRVALQSVAMLHAVSMAMARTSGRPLSDMFPFAVEAETFRQVKDFFTIDTAI